MKKYHRVIALILLLTVASGCQALPRTSEIGTFEIIQVFGVDKIADGTPNDVEITMVAGRGAAGIGGEGGGKPVTEITSVTARTVFEAISLVNVYTDKHKHFGYIDFALIGEEAAKDDLGKYIDFFARDHESRYSSHLFIVRGETAKEFLRTTISEERDIVEAFDNLDQIIDVLSNFGKMPIIELVNAFDDPDAAAIVPALRCIETDFGEMVGGEMPEKTFVPAGYAIIKDFKLVGYIETEYARGYNFLTGNVFSTPLSVKDSNGGLVAAEVTGSTLKFEPKWRGNQLAGITYRVSVDANITEQFDRTDIYNEKELKFLGDACAEILREEMRRVIAQSQELQRDFFGTGTRVRMRNPLKWAKIEDNWAEIYANLPVTLDVKVNLRRPYDIRQPNGYRGEV